MSDLPSDVSQRMRDDWNQRAREDAHYYVAFGGRDQDAEGFDATAADVLPSIEFDLKRLPKNANRRTWRALEIGCGPGRLMKPLSRHFGEIHGVDVSDEMIELARERLGGIPHAHVHATNGASLAQFADNSFDFVYTYAVFQHIPSRDVVLEYLREADRVLKPGGVFRGHCNALAHSGVPDTWTGVTFSAAEMRDFTRTNHLQLLDLANPNSRYFWTTWRKRPVPPLPNAGAEPVIRRVTNAWTFERAIPNSGPLAGVAAWIENIPAGADLNNLEFAIDGARTAAVYIGAPDERGLQQLNAWIPKSLRTGLLPVELYWSGERLGPPATARVIPAGPPVPRIISVTDGLNIGERNRSTTGSLRIILNAVQAPERPQILVGGRPVEHVSTRCIDSLAPLHEVDIDLPSELAPGRHLLELRIGRRALPAEVEVVRRPRV